MEMSISSAPRIHALFAILILLGMIAFMAFATCARGGETGGVPSPQQPASVLLEKVPL